MRPYILLSLLSILNGVNSFNDDTHFVNKDTRIVIIADIHNDMNNLQKILFSTDIIDVNHNWIASPNTIVVQLGDQIDAKSKYLPIKNHFRIVYYTDYLKKEARKKGSDFISIIGNHEILNMDKIIAKEELKNIISTRPIILLLNNYLFCHGGFVKRHYDIMNMLNKNFKDINNIWEKYVNGDNLVTEEKLILNELILDKVTAITTIRKLDDDNSNLFGKLNINYLFVGHSTVKNIYVKNLVWYLDLYLEDAFCEKRYSHIEICDGNITNVIYNNYYDFFDYLL